MPIIHPSPRRAYSLLYERVLALPLKAPQYHSTVPQHRTYTYAIVEAALASVGCFGKRCVLRLSGLAWPGLA